MDILKNIRELLYEHDCVILPEFGGFIANYEPARVDYDRNTFAPPSKRIGFNSQLTHNDGLLISSVSRTTGLGYKNARVAVNVFINDLKNRLGKGKKVVLEDLGTFFTGKDRNIQFEPDHSVNYLVQSFGLSSFEFDLLEEFDVRQKIQSKLNQGIPSSRRKRRTLIRSTIIAVPVLVALTLLPIKTNWFRTPLDLSSLNPFKKTAQTTYVIPNQQVLEPAGNAIQTPKEFPEEELHTGETITQKENEDLSKSVRTPDQTTSVGADPHFYVIVGSFQEQNNAIRLQNDLLQAGYQSELFNTSSGFTRVSLQGFSSYNEASEARRQYEVTHPVEGYWILEK